MSKLQVGDNSLVDIANMTLANQLESRLKELERNSAGARQFSGMADECYSKVKHEWELLQQDIGVKSTTSQTRHIPSTEERTDESETREPRRLQRRLSRSSRVPEDFFDPQSLSIARREARDLLEVIRRKNGHVTKRHVYTRKCTQS